MAKRRRAGYGAGILALFPPLTVKNTLQLTMAAIAEMIAPIAFTRE